MCSGMDCWKAVRAFFQGGEQVDEFSKKDAPSDYVERG